MKKKTLIFGSVIVLVIVVSAGLGYTAAYVQGLQKVIDMNVRTQCYNLLLESFSLSRSSDIKDLFNSVEQKCTGWASFILANEPFCSVETQKRIEEALGVWEKAKRKLEDLRSSYIAQDPNNT
jgi:hypothetical protein